MTSLLNLFKIENEYNLKEVSRSDRNIIINPEFKTLLEHLNYFKSATGIALLPQFDKEYQKKKNELLEINASNIEFVWNNKYKGFQIKFDESNFIDIFGVFLKNIASELSKVKKKDDDFCIYEYNNQYQTFNFTKEAKPISVTAFFEGNEEKLNLNFSNLRALEILLSKFKIKNNDLEKFNKEDLERHRKELEKNIIKELGKANNLTLVFNCLLDLSNNYQEILKMLKCLEQIKDKKAKTCLEEKLNSISKTYEEILVKNVYGAIGTYQKDKDRYNIDNKSFPFSISFILDFTNIGTGLVILIPEDIPKISKDNISISVDADEILIEKYTSDKSLTIDLFALENIIAKHQLGKEHIFENDRIINVDKWNQLIDEILNNFNFYNYSLAKNIVFFEPSIEIRSLYDSYQLAIETINAPNKLQLQSLKENLLFKLLNSKDKNNNESLEQQTNILTDNSSPLNFYGYLKENIINKKDDKSKFDYYGLNVNQRIFANKSLNFFNEVASDTSSNVIALNGPPGTGKTTVLQTVVANIMVKNALFEKNAMVIFGCSATNQAKNNIINGFKYKEVHSKENDHPIYNRWIESPYKDTNPNLDYGMSLASDAPIKYNDFVKDMYKTRIEIEKIFLSNFKQINYDSFSFFSEKQKKSLLVINNILCTEIENFKFNVDENNVNITYAESILKKSLNYFYEANLKLEKVKNQKINYFKIFISEQEIQLEFPILPEELNGVSIERIKKEINEIKNEKLSLEKESKKYSNTLSDYKKEQLLMLNEHSKKRNKTKNDKKECEEFWNNCVNAINAIILSKQSMLERIKNIFNKENKEKTLDILFSSFISSSVYKYCEESIEKLYEKSKESIINDKTIKYSLPKEVLDKLKFNFNEINNDIESEKSIQEEKINSCNLLINECNEKIKVLTSNIFSSEALLEKHKKYSDSKEQYSKYQKNIELKISEINNFINNMIASLGSINDTSVLRLNSCKFLLSESGKISFIIDEINDIITTTIDNIFKPLLFHIAMRWQECKFIEEINKFNDKDISSTSKLNIEKKYRTFSRITPVFVSTMHSLSNKLKFFSGTDFSNIGFIDVLIIDEAGQVSPEVGAISLLLAKKALIVGDTYQIEPVYNLDKNMDLPLYNSKHLNKLNENELSKNVWNCNSSSIMKVAQKYTPWNQYPELERGLYLVEHNRCPIELISFCDELIYRNNLSYTITSLYCKEGKKEAIYDNVIKNSLKKSSYSLIRNTSILNSNLYLKNQVPWKLIDNDGECNNGIRVNEKEVQSILEWIDANYTEIMSNKNAQGKRFKDIIAIITPFKLQSEKIKYMGKSHNYKTPQLNELKLKLFSSDIKEEDRIIIGTVHSLQGAEIPIVLFSNVYGLKDKGLSPFIDRQPSIINVGVSRAKQSFYIFANNKFLEEVSKKSNGATALLYKYIKMYKNEDF